MAIVPITSLPSATTSSGADILAAVQGGITKQMTIDILSNSIGPNYSTVTPEQYGAIGNGVADDTTAVQNAINSGNDVLRPLGSTYKTTSGLTMSTNYQRFFGPGILKPTGNFNALTVTGGAVGTVLDLTYNAPGHVGGYCVAVDNAHRTQIARLLVVDGYSVAYVQHANTTTIDWCWATARGAGVKWYGTNALRSDILLLGKVVISCAATEYGLDWDGNCDTLTAEYVGIVGGKGAVIRNTSGATNSPAIGRFKQLESDFSQSHGIEIIAGSDIDLIGGYFQGATLSGAKIGAAINNYEVRILGGKFTGNTHYGIENAGGVVLYSGASNLSSNGSGETSGSVWTVSPRVQVDANYYNTLSAGNPLQVYDANDYFAYDRASNVGAYYVGGNASFQYDVQRLQSNLPVRFKGYTVATLPASAVVGDTVYVTDANGTTYNATVAGGGANILKVFYNGTNWKIA